MDANKMVELQYQMKNNQADLQDYLRDLEGWTGEIKQKEAALKDKPDQNGEGEQKLPPVRNSLNKKKKKKKPRTKLAQEKTPEKGKQRISGFDFKAWDKFDVDKALEKIDDEESSLGSEYETDEEWESERRMQQAIMLKEQGNQYFKEKKYTEAIECYTQGISSDPYNAILPANRAMALLKEDRFAAAEQDCTTAISLDPTYIKVYSRRGSARVGLKKYQEAKADFERVLKLEPENKMAKNELSKIEKILNPPVSEDDGIVKPIYKKPSERSKKPLRRIEIEEIGIETQAAPQRPSSSKSETVPTLELGSGDAPKSNLSNEKKTSKKDNDPTPTSQNSSPRIPSVPSSSYQFQTDWKELKGHDEKFYQYFQQIDPKLLPKLFGQALDADILMKIFHTLQTYYIPEKKDTYSVLKALLDVKRFSMTYMFMSSKEKKVVQDIFDDMRGCDSLKSDDIEQLEKRYEL